MTIPELSLQGIIKNMPEKVLTVPTQKLYQKFLTSADGKSPRVYEERMPSKEYTEYKFLCYEEHNTLKSDPEVWLLGST